MGTSGIAAGAADVARLFEQELQKRNISEAHQIIRTGDRGLFRDVLVDVIEADGTRTTYEHVKAVDVLPIVEEHLVAGKPYAGRLAGKSYQEFFKSQTRIVLRNCGEIDPEDIDAYVLTGGYAALRQTVQGDPGAIVKTVTDSGLRGRGGAGFLTGMKWKFCREAAGDQKYIVCNADEGDPGAFMDRSLLEGDPHAVIEGMAVAGFAVGASRGVVYCRAEYPLAVKRLQKAIDQARDGGFLGKSVCGSPFEFDISIMQGAGAFVCGEETALLASIEGKRGMPRIKPPFPAQQGLWGKPTVINNVETFANVPHIIVNGAEWFASIGTGKSKGTKVFALAGKVKNTGLVEVPMGTTIRELVFGPGGGMLHRKLGLKGVQLGGPSGGCIPAAMADTPIDYESLQSTGAIMGSGGVIIMDEKTCMVDVARYFTGFTVSESCGQCTPCRVGLKRMHEVLSRIVEGKGVPADLEFLGNMGNTICATSLCGLGQTAPNPVLTTLRYFRDEFDAHVQRKECPAHVCTTLMHYEVIEDMCVKCGACKKVCPVGAVTWEKGKTASIDPEKCTRCNACNTACKYMAIH